MAVLPFSPIFNIQYPTLKSNIQSVVTHILSYFLVFTYHGRSYTSDAVRREWVFTTRRSRIAAVDNFAVYIYLT